MSRVSPEPTKDRDEQGAGTSCCRGKREGGGESELKGAQGVWGGIAASSSCAWYFGCSLRTSVGMLVTFLTAVTKFLTRSNLKKEGHGLGYCGREGMVAGMEVHMHLQSRGREMDDGFTCLSCSFVDLFIFTCLSVNLREIVCVSARTHTCVCTRARAHTHIHVHSVSAWYPRGPSNP